MSKPNKLLLHLVADLIRAEQNETATPIKNLLAKFKMDPDEVMEIYGLDPQAREVLFTMDRQMIGEYLRQELLRTPTPPSPDLWSDPRPRIRSVTPETLIAAPKQALTIMADCVLSSAEVHLRSDDRHNHFVAKPSFAPTPLTLKDEVLTVVFDLSDATPDDYHLLIYNTPHGAPIRAGTPIPVLGAPGAPGAPGAMKAAGGSEPPAKK